MGESELGTSKCILHWLLLYKLILYEEKMLEGENEGEEPGPPVIDLDTSGCSAASDQQPSNIPGSVTFLCSANDYLGQLGLCTADGGELLTILVEKTVACMFKKQGSGNRSAENLLKKACDQALYCLYAHPSKKSKLKHLVDHVASNVDLEWEHCVPGLVTNSILFC